MSKRKQKIQSICKRYKIKELLHFTHVNNLSDILRTGLLPRNRLGEEQVVTTDSQRIDAINLETKPLCLSISFPNYKMFYYKRQSIDNEDRNWVVIALKPAILWRLDCRFLPSNAASISYPYEQQFKTPEALESLFDNAKYKFDRRDLDIPIYYTTDPQAEVLVYQQIHRDYLINVYFYDQTKIEEWRQGTDISDLHEIEKKFGENIFIYNPDYFAPRKDSDYWKRTKDSDLVF